MSENSTKKPTPTPQPPTPSLPLRSFGRIRARKLRVLQETLLSEHLPKFSLPTEGAIELSALSSSPFKSLSLEIGFGTGEHLARKAQRAPDEHFIGCEPFLNGIANLLRLIDESKLTNIHLWPNDSRFLLPRLPKNSVDNVYILFPDPWPKPRHHKRRLINDELLHMLATLMRPGASLLIATDHKNYAEWILEHLHRTPHFTWIAPSPNEQATPPEGWQPTRYQEKAQEAGRDCVFLKWQRVSD